MKIKLIRHTSVDVPRGTCYGQSDVPLRDTFEAEAAAVRQRLGNHVFDKAYTSPLSRCTRLAAYCGYADAERDDRIKELDFGEWEMQPFDDIRDPRLQEWYEDYLHVRATGGESFADQYKRVADFLDELRQRDFKDVAVFAHGGVLICAQLYARQILPDEAFDALQPYGGEVNIEIGSLPDPIQDRPEPLPR